MKYTDELVTRVRNDYLAMEDQKRDFVQIYKDIARYLKPIYEERFGGTVGRIDVDDFGKYIFDGEGIAAKNRMVDGLFGWLVSPAIDWIKLESEKYRNNRAATIYLEDVTRVLMNILQSSNFYDVIHEAFDNGVIFGSEAVNVTYDDSLNQIVYANMPVSDILFSENRNGVVDMVHRKLYMTLRQVIEEFGLDNLDDEIKRTANENMEKMVKILHVVYPRYYPGSFDDYVKSAKNKPFASVYFFCGFASGNDMFVPEKVLRESGFDFKHFVVWRYKKIAGYSYGFSPAMDALFDIKAINLQSKGLLEAIQLMNKPPLLADMGLKGRLKIAPGAITYRTSQADSIQPIFTSGNYPVAIDAIERRARIIREHFRTDFFMSISQIQSTSRQRTATEILELKAESAAVLGSVVGRIQAELVNPIIANTIRIGVENDMLPLPPKGLEDIDVSINLIGPLAQAQRKYLVKQGIEQGLQAAFSVAQADPGVLINFDLDKASRELAKVNGYPESALRDEDTVMKIKQQQAQQQALMQQQAQQQEILKRADVNKAPEQGSILGGLIQNGQS